MRRVTRATGAVLQASLFVALVAIIALLALPRVSPFDVLVVRGGSMEPTIHLGSAVVVDRNDRVPVVGAVAMFEDPADGMMTHRVVKVADGFFETKGDANAAVDITRRPLSAMVGTIRFSVPFLGYALYVLRQPIVFFVVLIATLGMLVLGQVRAIGDEVRTIRRRHAAVVPANGEEPSPDAS